MSERRLPRKSVAGIKQRPRSERRSPSPTSPTSTVARRLPCNVAEGIVNGASIDELGDVITLGPTTVTSLDRYQRHPLELAAIHNREDVLHLLLSRGVSVNSKGPSGYTALHRACMWGRKKLVRYLLQNGADPTTKTTSASTQGPETPSDVAQRYMHYGCIDAIQAEIARRAEEEERRQQEDGEEAS